MLSKSEMGGGVMNFEFNPYVRHVSQNICYKGRKYVVSLDCRLIYVSSGSGVFITPDKKYKLSSGTLIYCQYGVPWKLSCGEDMKFYVVNFDFDFSYSKIHTMPPVSLENFHSDKMLKCSDAHIEDCYSGVLYLNNARWAEVDLRIIYNESLRRSMGYEQIQSSHLKITLINIYRHVNKKLLFMPICKKVESLVSERLDLNNKEIAEILNYHPFYLNDVFKKNTGITLHKYIIKQRMIKSYELLVETDMSLEAIALKCGFSSLAHFSKAFKSEYSVSPSELRKQK